MMRVSRALRVVIGASAALVAICATAEAKVVLGSSIDGVKLGMTHAQVTRLLGPGKQEAGDSLQFDYRHDSYQVGFEHRHVTSVETFDRGQRTSNGLGVGSSRAKLHEQQKGLHCVTDGMDGSADCYVGSIKRGHRYTDFYFNNSRRDVTAVIVADGYV